MQTQVGKIPWRRTWNPVRYSCLENPLDRGAWWATVQRITKGQTRLKWLSSHINQSLNTHIHTPKEKWTLGLRNFISILQHMSNKVNQLKTKLSSISSPTDPFYNSIKILSLHFLSWAASKFLPQAICSLRLKVSVTSLTPMIYYKVRKWFPEL